jgi:hypothetical protein
MRRACGDCLVASSDLSRWESNLRAQVVNVTAFFAACA